MAAMSDRAALDLTAQMARIAVLLGLALAGILALGLSAMVALLLGDDWADVPAPSIVLLAANVLWGGQWLLSRALASRGIRACSCGRSR